MAGAQPPTLGDSIASMPRAIVHVGHHKTGSTSLQTTLVKERATLLAQDNIAVLPNSIPGGYWRGSKAGANVALCLGGQTNLWSQNTTCFNCTEVLHYFEEFLKDARRARRGIILSAEAFDMPRVAEKLAATLRGFESTIAIVHRPYFDWVRSIYTQVRKGLRPPMTLSEYVSADRIRDAAASLDVNSVSVYRRYAQHFSNVSMRPLGRGYVTDFMCLDVGANATCRKLKASPEVHMNVRGIDRRSIGKTSCMPASRKDLLWTVSVGIEAQAQALMGSPISFATVTEMLAELRTGFARAPYPVCADNSTDER